MKNTAYMAFVDIWRLACRYRFLKLDDSGWESFIADGHRLFERYRGSEAEHLFRCLFTAVQSFYENI